MSTATIAPEDTGELRGTPSAFWVPDLGPDGRVTDDGAGFAAELPVPVLGVPGCEDAVLFDAGVVEAAVVEGARDVAAGVVAGAGPPVGRPLPRPFAAPLFGPVLVPGALPVVVREPVLGALGSAGSLVVPVEDVVVGRDDAELGGGVGWLAVELAGGVEGGGVAGGGVVAVDVRGSVGLVGSVGLELGWSPPPPWIPPPPFDVLLAALVVGGGAEVVVQVVGGVELVGGVQVGVGVGQQSSPSPWWPSPRCPG